MGNDFVISVDVETPLPGTQGITTSTQTTQGISYNTLAKLKGVPHQVVSDTFYKVWWVEHEEITRVKYCIFGI